VGVVVDGTDGKRTGTGGRGSRVALVGAALRRMILSGAVPVGQKLPGELGLAAEHGVSRTVVREAIASLRADGLVEARQGAGVFVTATAVRKAQAFERLDPSRISSVIEMLELRAAIEIEAAGLASQRRSPAQAEAVREACEAIEAGIAAGLPTTDADFAFHIAVADATNNARFREILTILGDSLIPRRALRDAADQIAPSDYLSQIQVEHRTIADAIARRDEQAARDAMRVHLKGSESRYRRLLRGG
jgi:GntR family transcriptional regulator, transcriptional repressor for pyruvate dehydrogenase complex